METGYFLCNSDHLRYAVSGAGNNPPYFVLESNSGGVYDYSLVGPLSLDPPEGGATAIENGQTMTLSGLSGITGAELSGALENTLCSGGSSGLSLSGFTSDSVTLDYSASSQCFYGPGGTYGDLEIDSSVMTLGTVNYEIENPPGDFYTGTAEGPVSPEPAAGVLLLTGIAALGLRRGLRRAV